ncbi:MAG TPA: PASTA domain-containing protein, partial [Actinomycetota bacterium]
VCTTPTSLQEVIAPSVVGLDRLQAMPLLEEAGFYVRVRNEPSTQPPGTVIYQDPVGGTTAEQTTTVTLTVAEPIEPIQP